MTTEEVLYTGSVTDIAGLVESCHFSTESYVLVERQPKTIVGERERQALLCFARLKDGIDIGSYTSGRVFNRHFELRWEQDTVTQGQISVVYLGGERELPSLMKSKWTVQPEDDDKERKYYLFGERLDLDKQSKMGIEPQEGYYAETRVPRLLRYPPLKQEHQPQRLQLVAREYRLFDPEKGREEGRTYRFLDLKAAKEEA
jgi:hypothetical protein